MFLRSAFEKLYKKIFVKKIDFFSKKIFVNKKNRFFLSKSRTFFVKTQNLLSNLCQEYDQVYPCILRRDHLKKMNETFIKENLANGQSSNVQNMYTDDFERSSATARQRIISDLHLQKKNIQKQKVFLTVNQYSNSKMAMIN